MHNTCFELIESERYNKDNPKHIPVRQHSNSTFVMSDATVLIFLKIHSIARTIVVLAIAVIVRVLLLLLLLFPFQLLQ